MTDASEMPKVKVLLTGVAFGESPRWHGDRLWFADWGAREIVAVDANGNREVMVRVSFPSFPLSFDWLSNGRLLVVSARDGLLLRQEPDGSLATHADLSGLVPKGRPWNEIVADGRGNAYVNNAGFEFPGGEFAPGSIALLTSDGSVRQVADGVAFPNGMTITVDNATLIVAEVLRTTTHGVRHRRRRRVVKSTSMGRNRARSSRRNLPRCRRSGLVRRRWKQTLRARSRRREVLQSIALDRGCFACILGGADRKTLFMVATEWHGIEQSMASGPRTGQVLTFEAAAPGAGWP